MFSISENSHSVVPAQAVQLALSMIAILTHHATWLLQELPCHPGQVYDPSYNSQLASVLPALKVAYDWMYCNKDLWYPTPPARPHNK